MHEVTVVTKNDRYTVGSFWDDRPEEAYDVDKKSSWEDEIKETRAKQAVEQKEWEEIRNKGKRITPDWKEYDAELAETGEIDA